MNQTTLAKWLKISLKTFVIITPLLRLQNHGAIRCIGSYKTIHEMMHLTPETARFIQIADDFFRFVTIAWILELFENILNFFTQILRFFFAPFAKIVPV